MLSCTFENTLFRVAKLRGQAFIIGILDLFKIDGKLTYRTCCPQVVCRKIPIDLAKAGADIIGVSSI